MTGPDASAASFRFSSPTSPTRPRLELYRAADRILVADETWIVPTVYDYWNIAHRPTVHGIWAHSLTVGRLDDVIVDRSR